MKTLQVLMIGFVASMAICNCGWSAEKKIKTVEAFKAEFKKCHAKGPDAVLALFYKHDKIPSFMVDMMKQQLKADAVLKIKEIKVIDYVDSNPAQNAKMMKKYNMMMPTKPTNTLEITFKPQGDLLSSSGTYDIGKIDGSYYIITPISAK
ncbi:hypothetical protein BVX99_01430 [bacterium F16]|nr:hypothetical protein BVX99_01430 [bacterium F16]